MADNPVEKKFKSKWGQWAPLFHTHCYLEKPSSTWDMTYGVLVHFSNAFNSAWVNAAVI